MARMTHGEYRVGKNFNPGGHPRVDSIKHHAAHLIDHLEGCRPVHNTTQHEQEQHRLIDEAQHLIEAAAMWGVKAVTKEPHA